MQHDTYVTIHRLFVPGIAVHVHVIYITIKNALYPSSFDTYKSNTHINTKHRFGTQARD